MADSIRELLGPAYPALTGFAALWGETTSAAAQSAIGRRFDYSDTSFSAAAYSDVIEEFSGISHAALEAKLSFGPNESFLVGFLVPASDAGLLFDLDLGPAVLMDDEKVLDAAESIRAGCSSLADIIGLMLFADAVERPELTVGEVLFNRAEESIGIIADIAGEDTAGRLDTDLVLPDGTRSRVTVLVPLGLLRRLAAAVEPAEPAASQPIEPPVEPPFVAPATPAFEAPAYAAPEPTPITAAPSLHATPPPQPAAPLNVHPARLTQLPPGMPPEATQTLDLILDVNLRVTVELGRNAMTVADILGLGPGSVVELDRQAGEPVDILVNDKLIARGEVVVVEENFGVRIVEIVSPQIRVAAMG